MICPSDDAEGRQVSAGALGAIVTATPSQLLQAGPGSLLRRAALGYAARGLPVFPLVGKVPAIPETEGGRGFHDASAEVEVIERWWSRWPRANIGFPPGRARLLVFDLDGPDGEAAAGALGLLAEPTLEVVTGRADGGRHRYYRHPGGTIRNVALAPHLDTRADHGYVLLPPSVHPSGRVYRWRGRREDIAVLPPRVAALLQRQGSTPRAPDSAEDEIPEGTRNATLTKLAGAMRRHGCLEATIVAALASENERRCRPPLAPRELSRIAVSVVRYAPALASADTPLRPAAPARRLSVQPWR